MKPLVPAVLAAGLSLSAAYFAHEQAMQDARHAFKLEKLELRAQCERIRREAYEDGRDSKPKVELDGSGGIKLPLPRLPGLFGN